VERLRELECDREAKREAVKTILAGAARAKRPLDDDERERAARLTDELDALEGTIRAEQKVLDWNRDQAPAVRWPDGAGPLHRGAIADDDAPALALPKLPERTRAKLAAFAGRSSAPAGDRRAHFAAVVRAAYGGDPFTPLLDAGNEAVGSEGGFALRDDMAAEIFVRAAEESVWMRIGARVETMISDTRRVVALDDDDESGDHEANLKAEWVAEGSTATPQMMLIREVMLHANKLLVYAACSNELGDDAPNYLDALEGALVRSISKKFDRAVLSGSGAGQPLGLLNAAATVEVAKTVDGDPGTTGTFTFRHACGMWSRLAPGSHERAYWLMHPTVLPQALTMSVKVVNQAGNDFVGGYASPAVFAPGGPTGYQLLGRPVVITGRVKVLSSKGDVILVDPTQVAIGIRRDITIDRSPHALFSSDQLAIRGKLRGDALPLWETARTLQEGTDKVSPYVVLAAR
jgi:HK97 family phage major capsid protein